MTSTHWLESRVALTGAVSEVVSLVAAGADVVAVDVERLLADGLGAELVVLLLEQPAINAVATTRAINNHRRVM
ncbi:hypothetical protein [Mycobacterium sp. 1245805.9]|uniref:hypothetical protein n=1 Tax=Mycobacterium sp. 1245805.9 TaxID=1856862 RepID=UPI000801B60F|nr:hypothetical protein [Mycobacterium sp. 1245805.9]OBI83499.1 hypothetical protein A9X00_05175 [Mycobacterium sp. 1245805.9]